MRKTQLLFTAFAMIAFFVACSTNEEITGKTGEITHAVLTLKDPQTHARTAGIRSTDHQVSKIEVYIFNSDGSRDTYQASGSTAPGYYVYNDWSNRNEARTITFMGGQKVFLVAVNATLGDLAGESLDAVRSKISNHLLNNTNSRTIPQAGIPMGGEKRETVHPGVENQQITIQVDRTFSRINPLKSASGEERRGS